MATKKKAIVKKPAAKPKPLAKKESAPKKKKKPVATFPTEEQEVDFIKILEDLRDEVVEVPVEEPKKNRRWVEIGTAYLLTLILLPAIIFLLDQAIILITNTVADQYQLYAITGASGALVLPVYAVLKVIVRLIEK